MNSFTGTSFFVTLLLSCSLIWPLISHFLHLHTHTHTLLLITFLKWFQLLFPPLGHVTLLTLPYNVSHCLFFNVLNPDWIWPEAKIKFILSGSTLCQLSRRPMKSLADLMTLPPYLRTLWTITSELFCSFDSHHYKANVRRQMTQYRWERMWPSGIKWLFWAQ